MKNKSTTFSKLLRTTVKQMMKIYSAKVPYLTFYLTNQADGLRPLSYTIKGPTKCSHLQVSQRRKVNILNPVTSV